VIFILTGFCKHNVVFSLLYAVLFLVSQVHDTAITAAHRPSQPYAGAFDYRTEPIVNAGREKCVQSRERAAQL
jgi:hypothetical protein